MNDTPDEERESGSGPGNEDVSPEELRRRARAMEFFKELSILVFGLAVGFFWSYYYQLVSNEAHIIVFLLLIIFGLTRYIAISKR